MGNADSLEGRIVVDKQGREYTIDRHMIEADELVLTRGGSTHPITVMDIADGPFELIDDE